MDKIPDDVWNEIEAMFDEYRFVYMATVEGDRPRVRPMTMNYLDDKFWILTGANDAKMAQLNDNPNVELCLPVEKGENTGYFRFIGKAVSVQDMAVKTSISERVDYFSAYWKTPEDPSYILLEIEMESVEHMRPGEITAKTYSL